MWHSSILTKPFIIGLGIIISISTGVQLVEGVNDLFPQYDASTFTSQQGTRNEDTKITHFDGGDYVTFDSVDFGAYGIAKSIRISYAKGNSNGILEARLGGADGKLIGTYEPVFTSGWNNYVTTYFNIDEVEGVHNLTFYGKEGSGILNLEWFQLSDEGDAPLSWDHIVGKSIYL